MKPLTEKQMEGLRSAKKRHLDLNRDLKEHFSNDPPAPPKPEKKKPKKKK